MADSSSSKKVQRAARAAASSRGASERRELGFPLILGAIVVLGLVLVFAANREQDTKIAAQPTLGDHWHAAYSLWDCDTYLPPWQSTQDITGIHSHQDSLIHVHPFTNTVTGEQARLEIFLDEMNADLNEERLESEQHGGELPAGTICEGEETVWRVARFRISPSVEVVEVYDTDLDQVQFESDREGFVIGRVPASLPDEDFPPPEESALLALDQVTGEIDPFNSLPEDVEGDGGDADTGGTDSGGGTDTGETGDGSGEDPDAGAGDDGDG